MVSHVVVGTDHITVKVSKHGLFAGAMDGQDFEIMMAHYVAFLSLVNHCAFFWIASILARWAERNCSNNHGRKPNVRLLLSSYLYLQHPLIVWGFPKYKIHVTFNILFVAVNKTSVPLLYFYKLMRPGTFSNQKRPKYKRQIYII